MKTDATKWCLLVCDLLFFVRYAVTTDQKSFGIDSVWSTGKKCYKILSFFDCKSRGFFRFYYGNLIYFIT